MTNDVEQALAPLVNLPLQTLERAADTLVARFGPAPAAGNGDGSAGSDALTLYVACPWRLTDGERVLVGSGDLFTPADPDEEPETFDWEPAGANWLDVRLGELAASRANAPWVVVGVAGDPFGGARLTLPGALVLELFPNSTPTGHVSTEFWRLVAEREGGETVAAGTFGIEREPSAA